jgi:hypothetical protein
VSAAEKDAVLFSGYFPNERSLFILQLFCDLWRERFADCDFFIGLNRPLTPGAGALLDGQRGLALDHRVADPRLVTDSDDTGFQTALQLLRATGRTYRLVWLMHSKSSSHCERSWLTPSFRHLVDIVWGFLARRQAITDAMLADAGCGTYSFELAKDRPGASATSDNPDDVLGRLFPFARPNLHRYFCVGTFYAMKGPPLHRFLDGCDPAFFEKNLVTELGADRYFFEQLFPNVAWRQGLHPRFDRWVGHLDFLEPRDSLAEDWKAFVGQ